MVMVSWLLMTALAVAEPVGNAGTTTEANTVLTATEIYGLLDDERWSKGTVEARRLLAEDPTSAVAHLTLGDALSHYPNEDGNTFAAFDSWMTAKNPSISHEWEQKMIIRQIWSQRPLQIHWLKMLDMPKSSPMLHYQLCHLVMKFLALNLINIYFN